MASRLKLHKILGDFVGEQNCYYVKPSRKLRYPCIVYELENDDPVYADNIKYHNMKRYTVTVMDTNPDSEIPDEVGKLTYSSFDRHFVNDNVHHFIFTVYF